MRMLPEFLVKAKPHLHAHISVVQPCSERIRTRCFGPLKLPLGAIVSVMKLPKVLIGLQIAVILVCGTAVCLADSNQDRRLRTGAKLFRALLAADLGLEQRIAADGRLHVLIVTDDPGAADEVAGLIKGIEGSVENTIRNIPLKITIVPDLGAYQQGPIAGVFIASDNVQDLQRIVKLGIEQNTIVYSPFEGHVEQGVLAGLSVEARVRPFLNRKTLKASGIKLKPFFLKVSRMYE